jgi:glycosyltransferase involved in cell wall biosynthesis
LKEDLRANGLLGEVEFHPNLDKAAKQAFMKSLSVFSVPALYGEAFGLYLVEAWAAGVPVVQPRHAAFPELLERSGAGVISEMNNAASLAEAIASVVNNRALREQLSAAALRASRETFNVSAMAKGILDVLPTRIR